LLLQCFGLFCMSIRPLLLCLLVVRRLGLFRFFCVLVVVLRKGCLLFYGIGLLRSNA